MKISELIAEAESAKQRHGDIEVFLNIDGLLKDPDPHVETTSETGGLLSKPRLVLNY